MFLKSLFQKMEIYSFQKAKTWIFNFYFIRQNSRQLWLESLQPLNQNGLLFNWSTEPLSCFLRLHFFSVLYEQRRKNINHRHNKLRFKCRADFSALNDITKPYARQNLAPPIRPCKQGRIQGGAGGHSPPLNLEFFVPIFRIASHA